MSLYSDLKELEEYDDNLSKIVIEEALILRDCFNEKENIVLRDKLNGTSIEQSYEKILNGYPYNSTTEHSSRYFNMMTELVPIKLKKQPLTRLGGSLNVTQSGHKLKDKSNFDKIKYLDETISRVMNLD